MFWGLEAPDFAKFSYITPEKTIDTRNLIKLIYFKINSKDL